MIKVIYVMKDIGRSGGAKNIYEILTRLQDTGLYDCELVYLTSDTFWYGKVNFKLKQFTRVNDLINYLKENNCIKVATWWETADWVTQSGGGYYFVQDIESSYYHNINERKRVLETYKLDLTHITINNFQEMVLKLVYNSPVTNIGLAIDHTKFININKSRVNGLLYCYRGVHLKNPKMFKDAIQLIRKDKSLRNLIVYNYGLEQTNLANHNLINITDNKLIGFMNTAKILLSTSNHEGFCMPILEAMACGMCVITTKSNGNMTFCIDNVNCLVVETAEDIVEAINKLLTSRELFDKIQSNALITAHNYTWDKVIGKLIKLFDKFEPLKKTLEVVTIPSISWVLLDDITPGIYNTCSQRAHKLSSEIANSIISSDPKVLRNIEIVIYQNRFEPHDVGYVKAYSGEKKFILDLTEQFWSKNFIFTTDFRKESCVKMMLAVDQITAPTEVIQKAIKDQFNLNAEVITEGKQLTKIIRRIYDNN